MHNFRTLYLPSSSRKGRPLKRRNNTINKSHSVGTDHGQSTHTARTKIEISPVSSYDNEHQFHPVTHS